ncbi:hypothetical protein Y032_0200g1710 [Ancylostoma ceylanicum]|uniref:Uncharacterized protein n=1 Tax=Ancylostoma ceylanicum TaxID=53326 RepID=A0A016SNS2_9BILA|nr:hypothetical protein Y032_0200g1710 [Ancylostoma ceylanicum]
MPTEEGGNRQIFKAVGSKSFRGDPPANDGVGYKFNVKKGDVVAIPTHAIPYYSKYDDATDSSSEYSEVRVL